MPKVILFDVDKTLVDTQYRLAVAEQNWRVNIESAENEGWQIGLNSDSSYPNLCYKAKWWGMNGPIISEKGAIVHIVKVMHDVSGKKFPLTRKMSDMRAIFCSFQEKQGLNIFNSLESMVASETRFRNAPIIVMDFSRERSIRFYVRRLNGLGLCLAYPEGLRRLASELEGIFCMELANSLNQLDWDINDEYGICIVHHKGTKKKNGVDCLISQLGIDRVYMVGDSMSDWIDDPRVEHFAVGNASPEFKEKCVYIADAEITKGAIQILSWLRENR